MRRGENCMVVVVLWFFFSGWILLVSVSVLVLIFVESV